MNRPLALRGLAAATLVVIALAGGACGVTRDGPQDLGDAYAPAAQADGPLPLPAPTSSSADRLVLDFLDAASGGGELAVRQVTSFLTDAARSRWRPPDKDSTGITIIRLLGAPSMGGEQLGKGVPVGIQYQVVGTLNEDGRVATLAAPTTQSMRFWVVRAEDQPNQLRIDAIDGGLPGLVLSDQALADQYYRQQPIYFWDAANKVLVPDLRYVPNTIAPEKRANLMVGWLIGGPSPLLGAVKRLPANTALQGGVVSRGSTLVVKLTPQAGGTGPPDVQRLIYQLQSSLRPATDRDVEVWIGNTAVTASSPSAYQQYDLSWTLKSTPQKFDIVDGQVKTSVSEGSAPAPVLPLLSARENRNVLLAAINRDATMAAFVRRIGTVTSLTMVRRAGPVHVAPLPNRADVGRPVWIPGTDAILVAWGGELYRVGGDGRPTRITPAGVGPISAVAISPDGRRVSLIANRRVLVAQLSVDASSACICGQLLEIVLDRALVPAGVAWRSEEQIYVAGASGGTPALWLVTADGVVATNKSASLRNVLPTDVVAYPMSAFASTSEAVVQSEVGPYRIGEPAVSPDSAKRPFFIN